MNLQSDTLTATPIHLETHEWEIVAAILRKHVPHKAVWAFGSRAKGRRLKRFSDLDLAVEGRLDASESFDMEEDFDESSLPIKVDVVELGAITAEFRGRIEKDFVLVQKGVLSGEDASVSGQIEARR